MAKILIAGDDAECVDILSAEVAALGHEVVLATTGQDAYDLALEMPLDMIFLDLQLPIFNAFETCRMMRGDPDIAAQLPIIFIAKRHVDIREMEQAGATGWITKDHAAYEVNDLLAQYLMEMA